MVPPRHLVDEIIRLGIQEDIGHGDLTTNCCIPAGLCVTAHVIAKSPGVVCGIHIAEMVFKSLDPGIDWEPIASDGDVITGGREILAKLSGSAQSVLSGERLALNLMQRMSGVATLTRKYVDLVRGTSARIVDTRKTTPGLRVLEKYAVTVGGGRNHRTGLFDAVMIKDNHIRACGSITAAVNAVKNAVGHTTSIEVETTNLDEVEEALQSGVQIILLDNMDLTHMREAVRLVAGRALTEASGGITIETVRSIAETGVNVISVGALTHSVVSMDISLDIV